MEGMLSESERERFAWFARSYHLTLIMGWTLAIVIALFNWNAYPLALFALIVIIFNAFIMIRFQVVLMRIYTPIDIVDVFLGLYPADSADQPKRKLTRVIGVVFLVLALSGIVLMRLYAMH